MMFLIQDTIKCGKIVPTKVISRYSKNRL